MAEGGAPGALERVVSEDSFIRRQFRQNKNFKKQDKQRKEDQGLYTSHIDDAMIQDVEITTSDVLKVKSSSPSIWLFIICVILIQLKCHHCHHGCVQGDREAGDEHQHDQRSPSLANPPHLLHLRPLPSHLCHRHSCHRRRND